MRRTLVLALLLLLTAGCGGSSEKPTSEAPTKSSTALVDPFPTGEISGQLLRVGGPAGTPDTSVRGTISIRGEDGSVAKAPVDAGGEFRIRLSPGVYTLTGRSPDVGVACRAAAPVTLEKDATVIANVICSIK